MDLELQLRLKHCMLYYALAVVIYTHMTCVLTTDWPTHMPNPPAHTRRDRKGLLL